MAAADEAGKEADFYPNVRDFTMKVRARNGHAINLQLDAPQTTGLIRQ